MVILKLLLVVLLVLLISLIMIIPILLGLRDSSLSKLQGKECV